MQDLETIETIWQLTQDWEGHWASWKVGKFTELQTAEMENQSVSIFKKLNKFSRELKVRALLSIPANTISFFGTCLIFMSVKKTKNPATFV